jgi:hypothetical protein
LPYLPLGKDWMDKVAWFAGLVLVGVGVVGVYLANRTLQAVERQADLIERQAVLIERQADLIQQQINDSAAAQAAQLTIEDLTAKVIPGDNFLVETSFSVANGGNSVAHDISIGMGGGSVNLRATKFQPADIKLPPNPAPNGPSLAPGKLLTYTFVSGDGPTGPVLEGTMLVFVDASVSYRDIFMKPHITTAKLMYDARRKQFVAAPHKKQHD